MMYIKRGLFAVALLATVYGVSATSIDLDSKDKVIKEAREAVATNYDNNWKVFAKSAQMVLERNVALDEAKEWIDASIQVKETPFNLELMGDYYLAKGDNVQAMDYYVQSLILLKETSIAPDTDGLQSKIWKARG
ncbi:MAG: hypothetical protein AAGA85_02620 [Bacteroidota bacterium]